MTESTSSGDPSPAEIREVSPEETQLLRCLLEQVKAFRPDEVDCAMEVVEEFHGGDRDYRPFILWEGDHAAGFLCFGKVPLTRTTYDLYWIAVGPRFRRRGYGSRLMEFFIQSMRRDGGRLGVIETSSLPVYARARDLYLRCGFLEKARLEGYYGEGDDLLIYTLSLPREEP